MKDQFYLHFPTMPKGTAQQKGYNRKTGRYFKKKNVASAEHEFKLALIPHRPLNPSEKPIKLTVMFVFDTKNKRLWGHPKATRPDTDNYLKLFKDCMTDCGFWKDDAQVWDERIVKTYGESASIMVNWEETDVSEMLKKIDNVDRAIKKAQKETE